MEKQISIDDAKKILEEDSKKITDEDIKKVIAKEEEIKKKFESNGQIKEYADAVKTMYRLIKSYWSGEYKKVPWYTITAIAAALLYVLSPVDFIPDFIPVIGLVDDALVVAACLILIKEDLANFEAWEANV